MMTPPDGSVASMVVCAPRHGDTAERGAAWRAPPSPSRGKFFLADVWTWSRTRSLLVEGKTTVFCLSTAPEGDSTTHHEAFVHAYARCVRVQPSFCDMLLERKLRKNARNCFGVLGNCQRPPPFTSST